MGAQIEGIKALVSDEDLADVPEQLRQDYEAEIALEVETPPETSPEPEPQVEAPVPESVPVPTVPESFEAPPVEAPTAPEVTPPVVEPDTALRTENERLERRVNVLVGMSKQVDPLQKQVTSQEEEIASLKAKVRELTPVVTDFTGMSDTEFSQKTSYTPAQIDEFGRPSLEMQYQNQERSQRGLSDELADRFDAFKKELVPQAPLNEPPVAQDDDDSFYTMMDRLVPDWHKTDSEDAYSEWLRTTGQERILGQAVRDKDAAAIAAIMLDYRKVPQSLESSTTPAPTPIASQIAPTPAAPGEQPKAPTQPKTITSAQAEALAEAITKGHFSNDPKEEERQMRYLDHVLTHGLVTP